jgi:hypothetical protein
VILSSGSDSQAFPEFVLYFTKQKWRENDEGFVLSCGLKMTRVSS